MTRAGSVQTTSLTTNADLALLVQTEQELEDRLAEARERSRQLMEAARAEAEAGRIALETELQQAREHLQSEVETERDRRAAEVLAEGKRRADRFDGITDAGIAELADVVLDRLQRGVEP